MRRSLSFLLSAILLSASGLLAQAPAGGFSFEQVRSYPFPNELTASASGDRIAWAMNERGLRNVYVAEAPDFTPRRLTAYTLDDGQELTSLAISADGKYVVFLRGGDHGSNWDDALPVNPLNSPTPPKVQILSVPFGGGEPKVLGEGEGPTLSPDGTRVAFERGGQIWTAPMDASAPAKMLFSARGTNGDPRWSPDGKRLAFTSNRADHAFIGVYSDEASPILWLAPSFARDRSPRWSPDGRAIVFVRGAGAGGAPDSLLRQRPNPWELWTADATTGEGKRLWRSPETLRGSVPTTDGETNLHWAANRIVFLSYQDGWPHLYSITEAGGEPTLLTPGSFMVEHVSMSPDRRWMVFTANAGADPLDIDRRHVVRVSVDRPDMQVMTPGTGLEWSPVVTGGGTLAFIGATAQRPPLPAIMPLAGGAQRVLAQDRIPADFPAARLVVPRQVIFRASDGLTIHAQLFEPPSGSGKRPAVIYIHGGPPRQMLLGWHYSDYYSNAYANNQYLASRGFVVLAVNYRLGIGYGYDFHQPPASGPRGASEYLDIKAAGEYLRTLPQVDPARIGLWGGSYGGYLTAMGLAHDSGLFAAGVDIHGVHDWTAYPGIMSRGSYEQAPDLDQALKVVWQSSPVSAMAGWKSPVLVIHADDDRNVRFSQSTDLVRRLDALRVSYESLVIPEDTHHWMRFANAVRVGNATADFLERKLLRR